MRVVITPILAIGRTMHPSSTGEIRNRGDGDSCYKRGRYSCVGDGAYLSLEACNPIQLEARNGDWTYPDSQNSVWLD